MMLTIWILAIFSTLVTTHLVWHQVFGDGISRLGWILFGVAAPTLAITYGILYVGGWPQYAAQWIGG